jgi:hypothetical protein
LNHAGLNGYRSSGDGDWHNSRYDALDAISITAGANFLNIERDHITPQ